MPRPRAVAWLLPLQASLPKCLPCGHTWPGPCSTWSDNWNDWNGPELKESKDISNENWWVSTSPGQHEHFGLLWIIIQKKGWTTLQWLNPLETARSQDHTVKSASGADANTLLPLWCSWALRFTCAESHGDSFWSLEDTTQNGQEAACCCWEQQV